MNRLALVIVLFAASAARAADTPPAKLTAADVLAKMDATNNGYADQQIDIRLTIVDTDGSKKNYDMLEYQKGAMKRLVRFTSGEMKGMSTLVEDKNSVWVYLPGYNKVRRVAAHNMKETIAGSDLSSEDMATTGWGTDWNANIDKEDDTSYWLTLTPKAPDKSDYSKIVHRVEKKNFGQQETHYYAKTGEEVKRIMASDPTDFHGTTRYKNIVFSDPRTGHRTELEVRDFKANQNLKDDMFTTRQLEWGK